MIETTIDLKIPINVFHRLWDKKELSYSDILEDYENQGWIDYELEEPIEINNFIKQLEEQCLQNEKSL